MKILHLALKQKWYDMIAAGIKTEEYREIKPYWEKRLLDYKKLGEYCTANYQELQIKRFLFPYRPAIEDACASFPRGYEAVTFHLGYTKACMTFRCEGISMGIGKTEWGAPEKVPVFIIKLGTRMRGV